MLPANLAWSHNYTDAMKQIFSMITVDNQVHKIVQIKTVYTSTLISQVTVRRGSAKSQRLTGNIICPKNKLLSFMATKLIEMGSVQRSHEEIKNRGTKKSTWCPIILKREFLLKATIFCSHTNQVGVFSKTLIKQHMFTSTTKKSCQPIVQKRNSSWL